MKRKTHPPRYDLCLTPEKTLELLIQISSGLLAGGHFREALAECRDSDEAEEICDSLTKTADLVFYTLRRHVRNSASDPDENYAFILPDSFAAQLAEYEEHYVETENRETST